MLCPEGHTMRFLFAAVLAFMLSLPVAAQDFWKGWAAYGRGDYATALREWRPLPEQGDAGAQYNLGVMYDNGQSAPQDYVEVIRNFVEAMKWLRKAAEQGHPGAQNILGVMNRDAQGIPQDYMEAVKQFWRAAEQGSPRAQNNLGLMFSNGEGVPQDYVQAYMWFSLAAAQGNKSGEKNRDIAARYMTALDIPKAQRLAREWQEKHGQ